MVTIKFPADSMPENKNIVTFSGPPDQSKIDEVYSSPSWNPNQRENIINMIK